MRNLCQFLTGNRCTLVHQLDASAAKSMMLRQGCGNLKHLDLRSLWVQETIVLEGIRVQKIPREANIADALCSPNRDEDFSNRMCSLALVFA